MGHALQHASELVKTYGHHGACCTCVGEAGHKEDIKAAGKFARTYADRNQTQDGMLNYVNREQLWESVIALNTQQQNDETSTDHVSAADASAEADDEEQLLQLPRGINISNILHQLREPLHDFTRGWSRMVPVDGCPPRRWGARFLSKRMLITRNELLTLMRTKLEMDPTWRMITLLATQVDWQCYGVAELDGDESKHRKIVGISRISNRRRDFVRLCGTDPTDGAALSAQVQMFVQVSGFQNAGVSVPDHLTQPRNNTCNSDSVTLALIRWLTPHRNAVARDEKQRPLCPAPFDINHALWTFAKTERQRRYFSDRLFAQQLNLFPGSDRDTQRLNAESHEYAMYDLVHLRSIKTYMNCTIDNEDILETVNLPFRL